jgi:hypothetical protein
MMADMLDDERVKSIDDMVSQGLNDDALAAGVSSTRSNRSFLTRNLLGWRELWRIIRISY